MTVRGLTFQAQYNKMNNIKEIKKMKMKNTILRALYGALTLSLIILGGCDQPTSSNNNNNNDPEEDLWHTLLEANGTDKTWIQNIDDVPQDIMIKFTSDRKIYIRNSRDTGMQTMYTYNDCTFDGNVIKPKGAPTHKIIVTDMQVLQLYNLRQFTLNASPASYIINDEPNFNGNFRSTK
jgi:hypothetical protein